MLLLLWFQIYYVRVLFLLYDLAYLLYGIILQGPFEIIFNDDLINYNQNITLERTGQHKVIQSLVSALTHEQVVEWHRL